MKSRLTGFIARPKATYTIHKDQQSQTRTYMAPESRLADFSCFHPGAAQGVRRLLSIDCGGPVFPEKLEKDQTKQMLCQLWHLIWPYGEKMG